jgi:hypothetical protein
MSRYAVLTDLHNESRPIGLAIERDSYVQIELPDEYGIPRRHAGVYRVLQPDGTRIAYRPGDEGYFDQLLVGLSTSFGIAEEGEVPQADDAAVARLLVEKVFAPRDQSEVNEYAPVLEAAAILRLLVTETFGRHEPAGFMRRFSGRFLPRLPHHDARRHRPVVTTMRFHAVPRARSPVLFGAHTREIRKSIIESFYSSATPDDSSATRSERRDARITSAA